MKIKRIDKIDYSGDVYNLRIKSETGNNHNYIANGILVSNCHHTNSSSIKKILSKCMHSGWRFGLTGTLTKKGSADHLTIQQYLGPILVEISPDFLFRNNYATPVSIKVVILDWLSSEYKDKLADLKANSANLEGNELYNLERKLVISNKARLDYIVDFINRTSKNSLVLFQSVKDEYGRNIWNGIREMNSNKEAFYVDGDTKENLREEYKSRMETGENKVLIATYGTFSTGISINNLHNIFLVESYKSEVLIKQSLGRGMRKMAGKEKDKEARIIFWLWFLKYSKPKRKYFFPKQICTPS